MSLSSFGEIFPNLPICLDQILVEWEEQIEVANHIVAAYDDIAMALCGLQQPLACNRVSASGVKVNIQTDFCMRKGIVYAIDNPAADRLDGKPLVFQSCDLYARPFHDPQFNPGQLRSG